jgi:hypothetical protein
MISKRFSIVSTCNLCIDSISKFIKKTKKLEGTEVERISLQGKAAISPEHKS